MNNTTKILIHNITTNELILAGNKLILADYFNVNWHSVVEWFRDGKVIQYQYNGNDYILYKIDKYIKKYYPKGFKGLKVSEF